MIDDYLLPGVTLEEVISLPAVYNPAFSSDNWQVSQREYMMQADGVASFYVRDGNYVEYVPVPDADPGWVRLYLRGQVLVALLHQRSILNFHASSFNYDGRGIMILGSAGTGKSSLTAAFTLEGAGFLSDDITPVIFRDGVPLIWPLGSEIRLRDDTVEQLRISSNRLSRGEVWTGKHHLVMEADGVKDFPLYTVLKIETGECRSPEFNEPLPAEKFSLLRSEVCSWEMLAGMPETEAAYLQQLVEIVERVRFMRVMRPAEIRIAEMHEAVRQFLEKEG